MKRMYLICAIIFLLIIVYLGHLVGLIPVNRFLNNNVFKGTPNTSCNVDTDCVVKHIDCNPCGNLPGGAVNVNWAPSCPLQDDSDGWCGHFIPEWSHNTAICESNKCKAIDGETFFKTIINNNEKEIIEDLNETFKSKNLKINSLNEFSQLNCEKNNCEMFSRIFGCEVYIDLSVKIPSKISDKENYNLSLKFINYNYTRNGVDETYTCPEPKCINIFCITPNIPVKL